MQKNIVLPNLKDLSISDAWSLARELRDKAAYIKCCRSCQLAYFTSLRQYTQIDCPFCLP